jgi:hypothetical protein
MLKYNDYIKEVRNLGQFLPIYTFIQAANRGNNNKVKELIKSGININAKDKNGKTALMQATINSFLMVVITLLDAGADPNLQNNDGRTALMMASTNKIIDKLLDAGADINITNNNGDSVVMDNIQKFRNLDRFEKFINSGLDLSIKNDDGFNFYDKLLAFKMLSITHKEDFDEIIKYMNEHFPQYKEEWELKQAVNKYNL